MKRNQSSDSRHVASASQQTGLARLRAGAILPSMIEDTQADQVQGGEALSGAGIARAAGLLVIGFILSRVLGLVREVVLAGAFGGSIAYEAYVVAARPPETLFFVVAGGALGSAFIPTFASYLARDERGEAWRLASAVLNLITLIVAMLSVLAALFAPWIVANILAPCLDPSAGGLAAWIGQYVSSSCFGTAELALTTDLMRIMLISPAVFAISGLFMGMLNTHGRFLLPAVAPALYNVGIIFGAVVLAPSMDVHGLAWGVVIGALMHLGVQIPGVLRLGGKYRPVLDIAHEGVREVLRLMAPRVLGLAVVQINFWVNIALASGMAAGSLAALMRAWFILLLPQGVIAQSVANAVFPTFSVHAAKGETDQLSSTLSLVLRAVLFLSIPATVGLVVLRLPLVRLIYEYGVFTIEDSHATAWALLFYGLGLASHALVEIVTRAFYALHDTLTPVLIGGGTMVLNVVLSLVLIQFIGTPGELVRGPFGALALANTIATTLEGIVLLVLIRPRVGGLDGPRLSLGVGRTLIASAGMGIALWLMLPAVENFGLATGTIFAIALGGGLFVVLAWVLRSEELALFVKPVVRRLGLASNSEDSSE